MESINPRIDSARSCYKGDKKIRGVNRGIIKKLLEKYKPSKTLINITSCDTKVKRTKLG